MMTDIIEEGCRAGPRYPAAGRRKHAPRSAGGHPDRGGLSGGGRAVPAVLRAARADRRPAADHPGAEEPCPGIPGDAGARRLRGPEDVPAKQKGTLGAHSGDLNKEAGRLLEAAKAKNVKEANTALQRIHLMVRELRLDQ